MHAPLALMARNKQKKAHWRAKKGGEGFVPDFAWIK
jgi:hypothetical protein